MAASISGVGRVTVSDRKSASPSAKGISEC